MNSSPFPLLRLPLVPFGKIIRLINPLPLALCSTRCQNAVRALNLETKDVFIRRSVNECTVDINFECFNNSWSFSWNEEEDDEEFPDRYVLGGHVFKTLTESEEYADGNMDFVTLWEDHLLAVNILETFLKSIFHCENISQELDGTENITEDVINIINSTHLGSTKLELGWLKVERNGVHRVFEPIQPSVGDDALKLVLSTLQEDIDLKISICPGEEFQYNEPIRQKTLHMATANWFTFKNLIYSKCENFTVNTRFRSPSWFTLKNANRYLKRWYIGAQPYIRKILIKCEWNKRQINQKLFDGIDVFDIVETTEQDDNDVDAYQFECKIQAENGSTASVSIKQQEFTFQVL
ncbi:hypothetical protein CRE_24219 [Caenorhabditis remanei]|uniref:Uncharacterized protein n=1 Tax=Caenorhabditis remanei TaxID=31234 RepID=E3NCV9_CAERE|nr:hypothetical protein CRE_24219 [Caenorhabditis remanei]